MARPPRFEQHLADAILDAISDGASATEAAEKAGVPRRTLRSWIERQPAFAAAYDAAAKLRVDALCDDVARLSGQAQAIAEAADKAGRNANAAVGALRVEIDAKRWLLAKLDPRRFSDRQIVAGDPDQPLIPAEVEPSRVALAILALLGAARPQSPLEHAVPRAHAILYARPAAAALGADPPPPTVDTSFFGYAAPTAASPPQQAEPPKTEAVLREERRIEARRRGPVFDRQTGRVVSFSNRRSE